MTGVIENFQHTKGHYPVMLPEVLAALNPQDGQVIVDGTFGGGSYSRAILELSLIHI